MFGGFFYTEVISKHAKLLSEHLKDKEPRKKFLDEFKLRFLERNINEDGISEISKTLKLEEKVVTDIFGFLVILIMKWVSKDVSHNELKETLSKLIKSEEIELDIIKLLQDNKSSFSEILKDYDISFSPEIRSLTFKVNINFKDENYPFNPKVKTSFKLDYDNMNNEEKSFHFETSEKGIDQLIETLQEAKREVKKAEKFLKDARQNKKESQK